MKKTAVFITTLLTALALVAHVSFADDEKIVYKVKDRVLTVLATDENEFVNLTVMPAEFYDKEELSEEELASGSVILKTAKTDAGVLSEEIELSDSFPVGTFVAEASGKKVYKRLFVNPVPSVLSTVAAEAQKSEDAQRLISQNLASLGFNASDFNKYGKEITELLLSYCDVYDAEEENFADLYLLAEGTAKLCGKDLTFEEMLSLYGGVLSFDLEEKYLSLDDETRKELEKVIIKQEFKNKKFEDVYNEACLLANVNANGKKASEELLKYLEESGVDMDDFEDLSSYYQDIVLGEVMQNASYDSMDSLIQDFEESVSTYAEKTGGSSGGGSSGGGSSGGGGKSSGGSSFSAAPVTEEEEKRMFSDVSEHWAREDIEKMAEGGIVSGFQDGTFKPENKITRAEFAKIMSSLLGLEGKSGDKFSDVTEDKWFAPFVYAAADYGIINGVSDDLFMPDSNIKREDAAVIMHRILAKNGIAFDAEAAFTDNDSISDYAKEAVSQLAADGIIKGADGAFNPKSNLTRAEAVTLIARISVYIK